MAAVELSEPELPDKLSGLGCKEHPGARPNLNYSGSVSMASALQDPTAVSLQPHLRAVELGHVSPCV